MAETKKTAIAKPVAKVVAAKAADAKKEEAKVEAVAAVKEEPKAEVKKAPAKKPAAKKTTGKAETKKPAAKKTAAKAAAATKTAANKEPKAEVVLQFAGKTYSNEDLVKIAKDVWQYDLKRELKDFKTVSIYVKPEEKLAYYVVNGDVSGSFAI